MIERMSQAAGRRWRSLPPTLRIGLQALWYLGLIALLRYLWHTPEADFRYWGL